MSLVLDAILVLIFVIFFALMAKKGFVKALYGLAGNIIAIMLTLVFINPASEALLKTPVGEAVSGRVSEAIVEIGIEKLQESIPFIESLVNTGDIENSISIFVIKIIAVVGLFIIMKLLVMLIFMLIGTVFKLPLLSQVNSFAGGIVGLINAAIIVYIICAALSLNANISEEIEKTMLLKHFYNNNFILNLFI